MGCRKTRVIMCFCDPFNCDCPYESDYKSNSEDYTCKDCHYDYTHCSCDDDYRSSDNNYCEICYNDDAQCGCYDYPNTCTECKKIVDDRHDMCYSCYREKVWLSYQALGKLRGHGNLALKVWEASGLTQDDLKAISSRKPCYAFLNTGKCTNTLCIYKHSFRSSDPCPDFLEGHCPKGLGCFKQHKYPRKCRNGRQCQFGKRCRFFHPWEKGPSLKTYSKKVTTLKRDIF